MLEITGLDTGYGKKQVLFRVSLEVCKGDLAALIGPNGAGKSTVLKAVCGLVPVWNGEIRFDGSLINGFTPAQSVAAGLTFAPQGTRVFSDLTVVENLQIGGSQLSRKQLQARIGHVIEMFPVLKSRFRHDAGNLSGGEQQMLALARALIPKPKLLMLDEPSLGLSPGLVHSVLARIAEINRLSGVTVIIVEQNVREVLAICNRVYSMKLGRLAFAGPADKLRNDRATLKELFL